MAVSPHLEHERGSKGGAIANPVLPHSDLREFHLSNQCSLVLYFYIFRLLRPGPVKIHVFKVCKIPSTVMKAVATRDCCYIPWYFIIFLIIVPVLGDIDVFIVLFNNKKYSWKIFSAGDISKCEGSLCRIWDERFTKEAPTPKRMPMKVFLRTRMHDAL